MLTLIVATTLALQQSPPMLPVKLPATTPPPADASGADLTAQATAAAVNTPPRQVCRMEPVTGSRFGRRVCRGAAQTDEDRSDSREMLRRMQGARTPPVG